MTKAEKLLVIRLGAGELHTSDHQREYVRLSAAGLVDRQPSLLHANAVSLTERGKEARRLFTVELLDMLRSQMPAHDEFQRVRNKSKKPCHCGECWAVREHDRAFQRNARRGMRWVSPRFRLSAPGQKCEWSGLFARESREFAARAIAREEGRTL